MGEICKGDYREEVRQSEDTKETRVLWKIREENLFFFFNSQLGRTFESYSKMFP